jgi:NADH-quinone oxidoreductase subunit G
MIKQGGDWKSVDWTTALNYVANGLAQIKAEHGAAHIGALGSAHSTVEELHLLTKLMRGLGSDNIDHRLRQSDFSANNQGVRWLGTSIASLSTLQRVLVVGSFLRKDHPLFAQRLRQAARRGARIHSLQAVHDDWLMPVATLMTAAPSQWVLALADIAAAVAATKQVEPPVARGAGVEPSAQAQAIAASLLSGDRKAILLGNAAVAHPAASSLMALAQWIGEQTGASVGDLTADANTVGAQLVGAQPVAGGRNAEQMLSGSLKACLLLNVEPDRDAANPAAAVAALQGAEMVVVLTSFRDAALDCADVLLPIAPFTETSGTFVNAEGRVQSFHGVVKPMGETRPAWKVLRVLGNMLNVPGFDFETSEAVRTEALGDVIALATRLNNQVDAPVVLGAAPAGLERISDVPIYEADPLVRRAASLQLTADARAPSVSIPSALWAQLGLREGDKVRVSQGLATADLPARLDQTLAANTVRVPSGTAQTRTLGAMFGAITIAKG